MYNLLIEAGGLRQLARIHPEWHQRFLLDLQELMQRHGFNSLRRDGSLLYWIQDPDIPMEVAVVARALRGIVEFLQSKAEHLLDFVALLDYSLESTPATVVTALDRRLPAIRDTNCVYLSQSVLNVLEPYVEFVPRGPLYRVEQFVGDGGQGRPTYRSSVATSHLVTQVQTALEEAGSARGVWIHGEDRSGIEASVVTALTESGSPPVVVHCSAGMSLEELLVRVLQVIPWEPLVGADAVTDRLGELLSDPGAPYRSWGHRRQDLFAVSRKVLEGFLQSDSRRRLYFADIDLCRLPDGSLFNVLAWLPASIPGLPIIASAATASLEEGWVDQEVQEPLENDSPPRDYQRAIRFWSTWLGLESPVENLTQLARTLQRQLDERQSLVLYLASRMDHHFSRTTREKLYPRFRITPAEHARIVGDLQEAGFFSDQDPLCLHPALSGIIPTILPPKREEELDAILAQVLVQSVQDGTTLLTPPRWKRIVSFLDDAARLNLWHNLAHFLAEGGAFGDLEELRQDPIASGSSLLAASLDSAEVRLFLRDSRGVRSCLRQVERLRAVLADAATPPELAADYALSIGEFELASGNNAGALDQSKKAILLHQGADHLRDDTSCEAASYLLMARISLAQRRFTEAGQYLGFAQEEASRNVTVLLTARTLAAVRQFLLGNHSRASGLFVALEDQLLGNGLSELHFFARFVMARISVELGEYIHASEAFKELEDRAGTAGDEAAMQVAAAWKYRSILLAKDRDSRGWEGLLQLPPRGETLFFQAETLCRRGDFATALPLLTSAREMEMKRDPWPRLGICWDNGFASLEDLVMADRRDNTELVRLIRAYNGWALAKAGPAGDPEAAVTLFYDLTRGADGVAADPYSSLYNYLYSTILPETRSADRDDRVTVLGKAVKLMQERASRIDAYQDKIRFLRKNEWNRRLMEVARASNLV